MKYSTINIQGNLLSEEILQRLENANLDGQVVTDFGFDPKSSLKSEIEYAWSRIKLDWRNFYEKSQSLNPNDPYGTTLSRKWMEQFFETLGFDLNRTKKSLDGDNSKQYNISHIAENLDQLPIHLVGFYEPNFLDKNTLDIKTSGGTSRFSPHSLMQEYLNVTEHVYGIASNGMYLRLIRDSGRLIKLTYVEFDLKRLLEEDKYSEFTLLYRLLHASRFPKIKSEIGLSILEKYYQDSIETGNRIRDGLSKAVKESLLALGNGFLKHEKNILLRNKIKSGELNSKDFYRQLLRVIYRFLFLMVTEERDLIYDNEEINDNSQKKKSIYFKYYSIARLRKLSQIRYIYQDQFSDLWQGLVSSFQLFEDSGLGKKLGIEPLGGDLFKSTSIIDIHESLLTNKLLLECIKNLNEFKDDSNNIVQINYRSLDVEELGSVYEGLLELHPVIENVEIENPENCSFTFHEGTDRKTSGSYYTRPELVNELIKSALIPVIEDCLQKYSGDREQQSKALLKLKVCDAAAGSGHMLLAAARTIAWYLARVMSGEQNPSPSVYRKCLREVIQHCIYAVDFNPDAVELCKLALWLEGHNCGKPLSFLDHKIRNGNSLVGVTDLSVLHKGIPDDAFNQVAGDDKKVCQNLKKENSKYNKTKQTTFDFNQGEKITTNEFIFDYKELENLRQDDLEGVKEVKYKYEKLRTNNAWFNDWRACNIWTSSFFWNYNEEDKEAAPSSERLAKFLINPLSSYGPMIEKADALSLEHKFFHWPLEFPDVFEQGGFDVMLGNPPWEILELKEQEFFATRSLEIVNANNSSERSILIDNLVKSNPTIHKEYIKESHFYEASRKFVRDGYRFKLTAVGRVNLYSIFSEHYYESVNRNGRIGIIVPTGIATDDGNKHFFEQLINNSSLVSLIDFENRKYIFKTLHTKTKFCLLTISIKPYLAKGKFGFYLTEVNEINNKLKVFELSNELIKLVNPNTKNCPLFRTSIDAILTEKIYKSCPILINEENECNPWQISFGEGVYNMASDSNLFKTFRQLINEGYTLQGQQFISKSDCYYPLIEAKMIWHFDNRYGSFEGLNQRLKELPTPDENTYRNPLYINLPWYWVNSSKDYLPNYSLALRNVTDSRNERTLVSSIITNANAGHTLILIKSNIEKKATALVILSANINSIILDYIARQKIGSTSIDLFRIKQFPMFAIDVMDSKSIKRIVTLTFELLFSNWTLKKLIDDLWKESDSELKAFIKQQWEENKVATGGNSWDPPGWYVIDPEGCPLSPCKWDEGRRAIIKAELDAVYARLYCLTTDELRYILDPQDIYGPDFPGETFRVLKEKEMRLYGEYRTKRLVLEAWEKLNL